MALSSQGKEPPGKPGRFSGLAGALAAQSFTRGGGFLLKPGDTFAYRLQATLQERKGEYRFVDGSLDRR